MKKVLEIPPSKVYDIFSKLVYFAAFSTSFIRAVNLFKTDDSPYGYLVGITAGFALDAMLIVAYSGVKARAWNNNWQAAIMVIGTYMSLAASALVQITEYFIENPMQSGTLVGIVAPSSATFALGFIVTLEFFGLIRSEKDTVKKTIKVPKVNDKPVDEAKINEPQNENESDDEHKKYVISQIQAGVKKSEIIKSLMSRHGMSQSSAYRLYGKLS